MPVHADGYLIPFTSDQIAAMELRPVDASGGADIIETREIGQSTLRREWFCKWEERYNACELIFGDEKLWVDGGYTKLSRLLPDDVYGRHPERPEIVATKLESMTGFGACEGVDDNDFPIYPEAKLTVLYEHVPYDLATDEETYEAGGKEINRYVWYTDAEGSAETITMPGGNMKFVRPPGTGTAPPHLAGVPYNISFTRPTEMFTYTHERVPFGAFDTGGNIFERVYGDVEGDNASFMGCINKLEFRGRAPGTVLYLKCKPRLLRSHTGKGRRWSLAHAFLYAPTGHTWLRFFDPDGVNSDWYMVTSDNTHHYADTLPDNVSIVTGARDLNKLFEVSAV